MIKKTIKLKGRKNWYHEWCYYENIYCFTCSCNYMVSCFTGKTKFKCTMGA